MTANKYKERRKGGKEGMAFPPSYGKEGVHRLVVCARWVGGGGEQEARVQRGVNVREGLCNGRRQTPSSSSLIYLT